MNFIKVFFENIKKDSSTASQRRHQNALALLLDILTLVFLTYVIISDFLRQNTDYYFLSIFLWGLFAVSLILNLKAKKSVSNTFFCCALAITCLYTFYIKGNSGVGAIWLLLLPLMTMYVIGLSYGFYSSIFICAGLIVLFLVPYTRNQLLERYSVYFLIRYGVYYLTSFILSTISMYNFHLLRMKNNEDQKELEAAVVAERNKVVAISMQTIIAISNAVEAKNNQVGKHSVRVAHFSCALAERLGWKEEQIQQLHTIAMLHDIGKIGVESRILNKETELTDDEYTQLKRHTVIGGSILRDFTIIPNVDLGAFYHHEHYDGSGYPVGLAGKEIPIEARIIAIADSFDSMKYSRGYKEKLDSEQIKMELIKGKGTQFDPDLADLFITICEENDFFAYFEV